MHVDKAWGNNHAFGINDLVRFSCEVGADAKNFIALDPEICNLINVLGRIDNSARSDENGVHRWISCNASTNEALRCYMMWLVMWGGKF